MASRNRRCLASWRRPRTTVAAVVVTVLGPVSLLNGLVLSLQAAPAKDVAVASSATLSFQHDILPIFRRNCLRCHDAKLQKGGLNLSTPERVLAGGESGPAVVPAQPAASRLYDAIKSGEMPLDHKTKVSTAELETIRVWIAKLAAGEHRIPAAAQLTESDVIPIFLRHCSACHNHRRHEGNLDLTNRASMLRGGKSGPALVQGNPSKSLMLQKILAKQMPPLGVFESGVTRPPDKDIEKLEKWIAQGAPEGPVQPDVAGTRPDPLVSDQDRRFWAFQAPRPVAVPSVKHRDRVRNVIDAFILQKLEIKGLTLSPEADRLTLIRRAYFDLTGLPPTPEEVRAFIADRDPQAYEKLIDRLLASPRFGERWGRYWLDLAGYADTESRDAERDYAWLYRDYVIRAFNADKPYDRFLLEQIAGDELADGAKGGAKAPVMTQELMDNLVATGFLRMTPDPTSQAESDLVQDRINVISDEMQVFSSTVLGLTIQCAQCHDHKLEPIPQRDYYRLRAVFKGAFDEYDWMVPDNGTKLKPTRVLPYVAPACDSVVRSRQERIKHETNTRLWAQIHALQAALKAMAAPFEHKIIEANLARQPRELRDELRLMLATPPAKRNTRLKYLAAKYEFYVNIDPYDRDNLLKDTFPQYRKAAEETERKTLSLESRLIPTPSVRALWDRGAPSPTYIYKRGDCQNPGRLVGPGIPSVLTDGKTPFVVTPPWPGANKTGARLALARWLIGPKNPLTARVWVNRLWQHHFGAGLVTTVENFGKSGARPTHPELLDWLALELVKRGWSSKAIHRLLLTSAVYRQSSRVSPADQKADPGNVLLSRMPLLRLDAESLRDSILFIAGRLDERQSGRPVLLFVRHDGLVTTPDPSATQRRSIYLQQRRATVHSMLDLFDYPQMGPNCSQRPSTAVAPQALYLLNNSLIRSLADELAGRVRSEAGDRLADQIDRLYWLALSRAPTAEEKSIICSELETASKTGSSALKQRLTARLCHVLINSSAFIYVE